MYECIEAYIDEFLDELVDGLCGCIGLQMDACMRLQMNEPLVDGWMNKMGVWTCMCG